MLDASNPNKQRISLLKKYLEDREDIQQSLYRLVRFAAELELDSNEMEKVVALLKPLQGEAYQIKSELEKLEKK